MKIPCNDCTHKDLCKFQDSLKETVESLNIKIPTPFGLEINCPYHDVNLSQYYQDISKLTITPNYINTNQTDSTLCTVTTLTSSNTVATADEGKPDLPPIPAVGI